MLTLKISTDNAAFEGERLEEEVARILRVAADRLERAFTKGDLHDLNGNKVGVFKLTTRRTRDV